MRTRGRISNKAKEVKTKLPGPRRGLHFLWEQIPMCSSKLKFTRAKNYSLCFTLIAWVKNSQAFATTPNILPLRKWLSLLASCCVPRHSEILVRGQGLSDLSTIYSLTIPHAALLKCKPLKKVF